MAKKSGLSFVQKKKRNTKGLFGDVLTILFGMFAVTFIAVVLTAFLGTYTNVVGNAMEPALSNGQRIYMDKFIYMLSAPKKGDVVVFVPKGNKNTHYYIKRVVGVPGDTLYVEDGVLYVNGERSTLMTANIAEPGILETEITLELDEFFCIGDNPGGSEDSRSANVGPVKKEDIIGKAWLHMKSEKDSMGLISVDK